jgi:hypothetical protein
MDTSIRRPAPRWAAVCAVALLGGTENAGSQTPEQERQWAAERERSNQAAQARAEQLARERAARKANPMAWVRTLDPMANGGWEFRSVANDGSWATFASTHQLKRKGQIATGWIRYEYAEPQTGQGNPYLSAVEKQEYDCKKQQTRNMLIIYYTGNNLQGTEETEEGDPKATPWNPIVPGTREETNFTWACDQSRAAGAR